MQEFGEILRVACVPAQPFRVGAYVFEQIAQEVGNNASGIGYLGLAYDKAKGVKVVPIDGKMPDKASVQDKSYPFSRPTFYYTDGEPSGTVKEFVDFTLSDAGQKIVEQVGFVPIR